jgi:hypothetical protein
MATEESVRVTVEELPPSELGTKVGFKFNTVLLTLLWTTSFLGALADTIEYIGVCFIYKIAENSDHVILSKLYVLFSQKFSY